MRVLFGHGFEGTPEGSKPSYMRDELGWDVTTPVMSELGWNIEQETEVMLRHIDEAVDEGSGYDIISGSSMGALAAANTSALRPDAKFCLLLIAPAFGLDDLWRQGAGDENLAIWEAKGGVPYHHRGLDEEIFLGWDFIQTADAMSWPELTHPTVIIHGTEDDIVPLDNSRKVADECDNVLALLEIEDGHRMQLAGPRFAEAAQLLGLM